MNNIALDGKSFNGWVVDGTDLKKEGVTRTPNTSYDSPTVPHGDWVLAQGEDYDIYFPGEAHIPRNVIIKNNSELKLGDKAKLNINFSDYKL
ncbi:hypothetical protein KC571_02680, partial [candidate division WWE3 bacterium]|nr:hypothetical protein [candidate division WWE3 bacterium]